MMNARALSRVLLLSILLASVNVAYAEGWKDRTAPIGSVPLSKTGIEKDIYKKIDELVPQIRKVPTDKIIWMECRFFGNSRSEQDIRKAFEIAGSVARYLKEKHRLDKELWMTAHLENEAPGYEPGLNFAIMGDEAKELMTVPVKSVKKVKGTQR